MRNDCLFCGSSAGEVPATEGPCRRPRGRVSRHRPGRSGARARDPARSHRLGGRPVRRGWRLGRLLARTPPKLARREGSFDVRLSSRHQRRPGRRPDRRPPPFPRAGGPAVHVAAGLMTRTVRRRAAAAAVALVAVFVAGCGIGAPRGPVVPRPPETASPEPPSRTRSPRYAPEIALALRPQGLQPPRPTRAVPAARIAAWPPPPARRLPGRPAGRSVARVHLAYEFPDPAAAAGGANEQAAYVAVDRAGSNSRRTAGSSFDSWTRRSSSSPGRRRTRPTRTAQIQRGPSRPSASRSPYRARDGRPPQPPGRGAHRSRPRPAPRCASP